jgi:hypothetical protein
MDGLDLGRDFLASVSWGKNVRASSSSSGSSRRRSNDTGE